MTVSKRSWFVMEQDHLPPLRTLAVISFTLMLISTPLFIFTSGVGQYVREYAGLIWHLSMFFFIMKLPTPAWGRFAGAMWVTLDVTSGLLYLNNFYGVLADASLGIATTGPFALPYVVRLGAHCFLGLWLMSSALTARNRVIAWCGVAAGALLLGYSLVSPFGPTWLLMLNAPFMIVWFALICSGRYATGPVPATGAVA